MGRARAGELGSLAAYDTRTARARIAALIDPVSEDGRWSAENDELGASIVGMLAYGYGLIYGRTVLFLDIEDIDAAVSAALQTALGFATTWTNGLVAEANRSTFDPEYHSGNGALIGVGHEYLDAELNAVVDNVFSNISSYRRLATGG